MRRDYKLQEGEKLGRHPNKPIVGITGTGHTTYLWIGNNAKDDKACFATLTGAKTLRALAENILEALRQ